METSTAHELELGSVLGGYRMVSLLGAGATGAVYSAEHTSLGRKAAVKVLAPRLAGDINFRARFVREANLVAAVDHPNIIPIYDAGEEDGLLYLAMQLVDGRDLDALVMENGSLDAVAAVQIIEQVAAALDAAHAHGLIHRDVKPGNVLIEGRGPWGRVYLADFGVAYQVAAPEMTRPGELVGTLAWLSPEQIEGRPVDERTDVYALAGLLFFALTGREPYGGDSQFSVLFAHLTDTPPLVSSFVANAPVGLDAVIQRGLAKEPGDRFPSAGELSKAARAAVEGGYTPGASFDAHREESAPSADHDLDGVDEAPNVVPVPLQVPPAPLPPPAIVTRPSERDVVVSLRLEREFEYVHEPLESEQSAVPFLGNQAAIEALKERIRHSSGGAFLVTGFRGVGKTTIIKRALRELRAEVGSDTDILQVSLNVARPLSTEAMLFEVVRRLFEELADRGVLASLPDDVQRAVIVAYTRTSLSFKETRSTATERARTLGMNLEALPMLGRLAPTLDFSRKQTDSLATEAAFLTYSDADVEHDFLRIVDLLRRNAAIHSPRRWSLFWRLRLALGLATRSEPPWNGRLVVVVDELDKLTATAEGVEALERILAGLKNLLTTRGVHFLFVGGPDLHDMALRESQRGSSVYESVFGWQLYVPCVWDAADELLDGLVSPAEPVDDGFGRNEWNEEFRDFLTFKARGIPRLLLLQLNSFVHWDNGHPVVALNPVDTRRVEFYAGLQRVLQDFMEPDDNGNVFAIPIDEDRWRLGAYYVVDWILRSSDRAFTVEELVGSTQETPLDPSLVLSPAKVRELVDHLVARAILVQVTGRPDQTFIGDAPDANTVAYRVVDDIYEKLGRFERWSERERRDLAPIAGNGGAVAQPWADSGSLAIVGEGRYELRRELARTSLSIVYRAYDRVLGREVALKLLVTPLIADDLTRSRFLRAAEVASALNHPNLVPTLNTFEDPDGQLGIVLELVDGTPLATVLAWGPLPGAESVRITLTILDVLDYLHSRGLARFDLKPSSILLDATQTPLISDVALAKFVGEALSSNVGRQLTRTGVMIGTPRYISPEQVKGEAVDIRTDLYAVGLILYEMLTGRPARDDENPVAMLYQVVTDDVAIDDVPASPALRDVLRRATARDPANRFGSPAEMRDALLLTPEVAVPRAGEPVRTSSEASGIANSVDIERL